jgi:regulatory protein
MTTRSRTGARRVGGRTGSGIGTAADDTSRGAASGEVPPEDIPGDPEQDLGDPESVARAICLRLLTQRARTRSELADALARRGVPDESAEIVLDRFTEVGLIDDRALAHSMAGAQHQERGLARRAVAVKLRRRGLDDDTVRDALADIDSDSERSRARDLVEKRQRAMASLPSEVQQRRLVGMLARKGYPPSVAFDTVRSVLAERATNEAEESASGAGWDDSP